MAEAAARPPVIAAGLLIAGTAVGAGLLGLPVKTGLAGLGPSSLALIVAWAAMTASAWAIARGVIDSGDLTIDLPSLFRRELGRGAMWLAVAAYLVNMYGIMIAYLAGGATVITGLGDCSLSPTMTTIAFFIGATTLAVLGQTVLRHGNTVLMVLLGGSFLYLIYQIASAVDPGRLTYRDWSYMPATLPIILCSFSFQGVVPAVCRQMNGDGRPLMKAILFGTLIPLVLALIWTVAAAGALPLLDGENSLLGAYMADQPATIPLSKAVKAPGILVTGLMFSLCAILTSYLGISLGLRGFLTDLLHRSSDLPDRLLIDSLVFLPPLIIVLIDPNLFLQALDITGGLSVTIVFGLLPAALFYRSGHRWAAWLLIAFFGLALGLEAFQELGWLKIEPRVEYWFLNHHR